MLKAIIKKMWKNSTKKTFHVRIIKVGLFVDECRKRM